MASIVVRKTQEVVKAACDLQQNEIGRIETGEYAGTLIFKRYGTDDLVALRMEDDTIVADNFCTKYTRAVQVFQRGESVTLTF